MEKYSIQELTNLAIYNNYFFSPHLKLTRISVKWVHHNYLSSLIYRCKENYKFPNQLSLPNCVLHSKCISMPYSNTLSETKYNDVFSKFTTSVYVTETHVDSAVPVRPVNIYDYERMQKLLNK